MVQNIHKIKTMANTQNLIPKPINLRTKEEQKAIRSKGGRSKSPKKSQSAKLREITKKTANKENITQMEKLLIDPNYSCLEQLKWVHKWKTKVSTVQEAALIGRLENDIHKTRFGEKRIVQSTNLNVQVSIEPDQAEKILVDLKKKTDGDSVV